VERYRGEPYAVAADIYSAGYCPGRCGWTWYTGSASWTYRIWIEEILGFHLRGDVLEIHPSIPKDWEGFEIRYRYRSTQYEIRVKNNAPRDLIEIDGRVIQGESIPLTDDRGSHVVTVHLGPAKEVEIPAGTRSMEMTAI
jgi:cellobiose phosphorylase